MISPHAHIAMTYQPPAPEPKHVHRVERKAREAKQAPSRGIAFARKLRLVPRHA
jgi:hypothetical protein